MHHYEMKCLQSSGGHSQLAASFSFFLFLLSFSVLDLL